MRIAIGIVAVLLVLAIIYYFLPNGIKTTVGAIFTNNRSVTQNRSASPSPTATVPAIALATTQPSITPSVSARASASAAARTTASLSPRVIAQASSSAVPKEATISSITRLPGTGFYNQPIALVIGEVLTSMLIGMIGYRLSKYI